MELTILTIKAVVVVWQGSEYAYPCELWLKLTHAFFMSLYRENNPNYEINLSWDITANDTSSEYSICSMFCREISNFYFWWRKQIYLMI